MDPYDEEKIESADAIVRRVNPRQHIVPDHNTGRDRISTKLFSPSSEVNGGMSVDVLALIEEAAVDAEEFVTTPVYTGSVQFPASAARNSGLWVGYHPIDDNPFHGEVWRPPIPCGRFTQAQKRALLNASDWFVELEGVDIPEK